MLVRRCSRAMGKLVSSWTVAHSPLEQIPAPYINMHTQYTCYIHKECQ